MTKSISISISLSLTTLLAAALASGCSAPVAAPACAPETRPVTAARDADADPALAKVAFLEGAWEVERDGARTEERWSSPVGGMMLATGRTTKAGKTVFFEYLRIEAMPSGIVYTAQPRGGPATAFQLVEATGDRAVFENPEHDFPKRITYARRPDGSLDVRTEGEENGAPASEGWVYRRAGASLPPSGGRP